MNLHSRETIFDMLMTAGHELHLRCARRLVSEMPICLVESLTYLEKSR